ncbi:glycosyltransferase family 2 protein [Sulfurimonas sp. CS5]|uniref:glycosyltransferase family 2 protein n=1 Tax=Sulfurimonas sp. CS5 TaxID=3391145 RepID=UPI0039ECDEDB
MNFCILIPVYNSPYIREVIIDVLNYGYKVIVVDDGSDVKINLDDLDIELVTHERNMGKGEAILSGASKAKKLGYDSFVTMDADKQHISSQIQKLVDSYRSETIIVGNRNFDGENIPNSSKFGRKFSNFWVMLETFKSLGDTQSGFRMYPVSILNLPLINKRFDFEVEILVLHSYRGGCIKDVEVECYYPPHEERISHFNKLDDNVHITLLHIKLLMQRYLLFRGWLWR